ncbi:MAG: tetratricopeptide repeat protein [Proteobacteria bacterium]|nr:tetratricopeptide repeat protein [Pseudomonadota bacterium]
MSPVYTVSPSAVSFLAVIVSSFLLLGCGGAITASSQRAINTAVVLEINVEREAAGLTPLAEDPILNRTARDRAMEAAAKGSARPDPNRLPYLVSHGSYSRFALSQEVEAETVQDAKAKLIHDPLVKGITMHPRLTHLGIGIAKGNNGVFAVIDLARVAPTIDLAVAKETLVERIRKKRKGNSVAPLKFESELSDKARQIATDFINGNASSDQLIAEAQGEVGGQNFSLGRTTIAFQVVRDFSSVLVPPRTSDPALAFAGIGLAQGNHKDHEPGSLAVVLLLAEPQTAHDSKRKVSNLPPPKSARGKKAANRGSVVDRAWIATLSGNHKKAAALFKQAYREKKEPGLLYEAARAYARDRMYQAAVDAMARYARLAEGKDKEKALEMLGKLKRKESIFATSKQAKISVEAKRFFVIGQSLFDQQEWDGAVDAFQQAYTYSKHPDIIYNIGLTYLRAGRLGEALDYFGEYQKSVPRVNSANEAKQLFVIGVELYQAGQFEAASTNFALAYAFAPFPELIYNLALCYKAMNQKEEALRFLREFIHTDPPKKERMEVEKMIKQLSR